MWKNILIGCNRMVRNASKVVVKHFGRMVQKFFYALRNSVSYLVIKCNISYFIIKLTFK